MKRIILLIFKDYGKINIDGGLMKIFITISLFLFSFLSNAGILIEPQLGYIFSSKSTSGTLNLTAANATGTLDSNYKAKGLDYGARLGYQFFGLMSGVTYSKTSMKIDEVSSGSDTYKLTNMGLFLGYDAPILVRVWGAYLLSAKGNLGDAGVKGKGTEFGLGYKGLPFLSLNFIYRTYDFTEVTSSGYTFSTSGFKPKEMELAVSLPFNLF